MARDPPSYDSGTLLSEADAKTIMDKIEARRKWLKANGNACGRPPSASYLGKHQRVILARVKSKADVTMESEPHLIAMSPSVNVTEHSTPPPKAHMFVQKWFKAKAHEVPKRVIHRIQSGLSTALRRRRMKSQIKEWNQDYRMPPSTRKRWSRYLARDPPSYDSGKPLSEADAKTMMDKIEVRSKWLKFKADFKANLTLAVLARAKFKADDDSGIPRQQWSDLKTWCVFHGICWGGDVPVLPLTPKHMYGIAAMFKSCGYRSYHQYVRAAKGMHIQSGAAWSKKLKLTFRETITMCPSNHIISESITRWNHYLARDPPSYDSGIPLPEAVAKIMMDKIEARSKIADGRARRWDRWDNTSSGVGRREGSHPVMDKIGTRRWDRAQEYEYEKGTIAGDDPKVFRDKYRFLPHRETETNLRNIWAAMQRAANYQHYPRDYIKRKAAFQQYKDANTNWKDVLLAYRADKIKEWNQDHDTEDHDKEAADINTVVVGVGEDTEMDETAAKKLRRNKANDKAATVPKFGRDTEMDETIVAITNKPSDVDGHRPRRRDPDIALSKRARGDTHDTPPHQRAALESSDVVVERTDSAIIPAALVSSPYPSEVGHRPPCDDPDRVREGREKGTIAGDDPKAFGDKYRFTLHGETETNLRNIWAAMQREAYKTCPVSARRTRQLKTTFQQYRDANTNWKDILLAYRADKIKEWNQDSSSRDWVQPRLGSECCLADSLLGSTEAATTDAYRSNSTHGATHSSADQGPLQW